MRPFVVWVTDRASTAMPALFLCFASEAALCLLTFVEVQLAKHLSTGSVASVNIN